MPLARISLTFSRHFSLSFIASGRSSGLHPVSSHSCGMYVRAGHPAFAWPYAGVHRSISLMSSFLLLQQGPACLVRLTCIVFVIGGRWPYSRCLVGCCRQDLFNIARNLIPHNPFVFYYYIHIYIYIYIQSLPRPGIKPSIHKDRTQSTCNHFMLVNCSTLGYLQLKDIQYGGWI